MTNRAPANGDPAGIAERIEAIAAGLEAAGLDTRVHETAGCLDITATLARPDRKPVQVICDEDGYVQVSYWNDPAATPAQVVAVITGVIARLS